MHFCNICRSNPCCCYQSVQNTCPPIPCIPSPCIPSPCIPGIPIQMARVAVTPQEFFAMPGSPKVIIPAPGVGQMISPILTWAILDFNTTPYDDGSSNAPVLIFYIGGNSPFTDSMLMGFTGDVTRFYTLSENAVNPAVGITCIQNFNSTFDNQPLTVSTNVMPLNGDSTIYIYCLFAIVTQ